ARGQVAQVEPAYDALPTVPSWVSEMLPLSFDLAKKIAHFRHLMAEMLEQGFQKQEILDFINSYLYVDKNSAESIYQYFLEQHLFACVPKENQLLIEKITTDDERYTVVHALFGRRVNDALSRAVAFLLSKLHNTDIQISINDNGFLLKSKKHLNVKKALEMLRADKFELIMKSAIENTEILRRRFRHVAARGLMILTKYKGHKKRVGKQQVSSMILLNAVRRISNEFPLLKEARREVLEDAMDLINAKLVVSEIESGKIKLKEIQSQLPSPFAFNIATQGYSDIMRIEDKIEFLRRMHQMVLAKIGKSSQEVNQLT
ncbi:ATP-dependent helicase, partial [Candidatus Woesearchaeota archaeon]